MRILRCVTSFLLPFIILLLSPVEGSHGSKKKHHHPPYTQQNDDGLLQTTSTDLTPTLDGCQSGWSFWPSSCGHGKECVEGKCVCVKMCKFPSKSPPPVCGSDGKWYTSKCELYRKACLLESGKKPVRIDHEGSSCEKERKRKLQVVKKQEKVNTKKGKKYIDDGLDSTTEDIIVTENGRAKTHKVKVDDGIGDDTYNRDSEDSFPFPGIKINGRSQTSPSEPKVNEENEDGELFNEGQGIEEYEDDSSSDEIDEDLSEEEEVQPPKQIQTGQHQRPDFMPPKRPLRSKGSQRLNSKIDKMWGVLDVGEENGNNNADVEGFPDDKKEVKTGEKHGNKDFLSQASSHGWHPVGPPCSPQEYEILKDNLLLHNHERLIGGVRNFKAAMESGSSSRGDANTNLKSKYSPRSRASGGGEGPEAMKDYLLSLMFSRFDRNNNGALEYEELRRFDEEENESLAFPPSTCNLVHLLHFDDSDHNGQLSLNEFYTAFNKLYSVSVISLDKALETRVVSASVGENVELRCDVSGSPPMPIVWRRYGVDLGALNQDDLVKVFPDGSLYLNKIQLLHAGNYSCHAARNQDVIQTHVLSVQTLPEVRVMPRIVWEKPGSQVSLECRVTGEPFPIVQWLKNDEPLPMGKDGGKYEVVGDGIRLTLKDVDFSDTGAYMCKAGKRLDIGSLVVVSGDNQEVPSSFQTNSSQFFSFHDHGISIYDPSTCRIVGQIGGSQLIPGTQEYVCGLNGICDWGSALKVSSYVYVSQPKLDRVLVISTTQFVIVDVVLTDPTPVQLHFVPHVDQVWVECWRQPDDPSKKTLQVIREASEKRKHHTVHPEPIDSHFDEVADLFLPLPADPSSRHPSSQFRYGYVSHRSGRGLYKMDLVGLRYTKKVDLTPYNCVPQHIQFSSLYGLVIVQCWEPVTNRPTGQLGLDALTDAVVYYKGERVGRPYLSPDSRKLVTVSHSSADSEGGSGTTLLLQLIRDTGLEFSFDVKTSLNISDVTFFPSQRSHTYDLYASSVDKDDVLFVDLESGKVEMVSGVSVVASSSNPSWKLPARSISSQGLFSPYLGSPSSDSVYVLNGQSHTVNCQVGGLSNPRLIVWL